jgi:hypothetical protein
MNFAVKLTQAAWVKIQRFVMQKKAPVSTDFVIKIWKEEIDATKVLSAAQKRRYKDALVEVPGGMLLTESSLGGVTIKDKIAIFMERGTKAYDMRHTHLKGALSRVVQLSIGSGGGSAIGGMGPVGGGVVFRTLSVNSPPGRWIVPARDGAHAIQRVWNRLQKIQKEGARE